MKPRIGVLTSGGDCPGLNAVLRAVVLAADRLGWELVGFRDGFEGLLPPGNHIILDRQAVNGIMALGGTILGTTNRGDPFEFKGDGVRREDRSQDVVDSLKERGIDLTIGTWRGIAAPKNTPPEVVAYLKDLSKKASDEPAFREVLEKQNLGFAYADVMTMADRFSIPVLFPN